MWISKSKERAKDNLAIITRLANSIASQHPDDEDAQWRAQTATALLQDFGITPRAPTARSSRVISASPSESQHSVKLPAELYRMIVGFVNTFRQQSRSREPTLLALSCTCKALNTFAEELIYKHPGVLHDSDKKWKFLFSLKIRPTRASLVRSLLLDWDRHVENDDPLMDILASCTNIEFLFVGNGSGNPLMSHVDQLEGLQLILSTCTRLKSLHYFTSLGSNCGAQGGMGVIEAQRCLSDWISIHPRVKQSLRQLETLGLDGPLSSWIFQGSLQYLSSNLTSLQLRWHNALDFSSTPLFDVSQQCQKLKVLVVSYRLVTTDDLEKACQAWASTLEALQVDYVRENKDWISNVIPHLRKLKVLFLARHCYVSADSIKAVVRAEMSLESISIMNVEGLDFMSRARTQMISDAANEALTDLIEAHSSTLRRIVIFPSVGELVIQCCKTAKGLRSLNIRLPDETPPRLIDGFLNSCPELVDFPESFEKYSNQRSEWKDRRQFRTEVLPMQKKLLEGRILDY
ncbi:uncharacterized protein FTJAE_1068 [Fusarium tjaetaba]|uniref:Uncharacterized protein n=1 Tax=Fusarium tjaetaba TaxID=1567544 RepID=A0A8H5SE51_9HYPO|nr:uncharacterized protein FTJAE_1068 [Fusarium tjaetaba]KAF5649072.1 hypothetical protein FTJAE_1068 [Fusarium tjaetaba]